MNHSSAKASAADKSRTIFRWRCAARAHNDTDAMAEMASVLAADAEHTTPSERSARAWEFFLHPTALKALQQQEELD